MYRRLLKPAFSTKYALYQWTVHQFSLANTPSQFMWVMNRLLASNFRLCKFVAVYLDDVLLRRSMGMENLDHMWIVLHVLWKAGFKLKRLKCEWFRNRIEFCGFQINKEVVGILGSKMRAVTGWPWPWKTKEISGVLSSTGYYCKFRWHYAHIAILLCWMCKTSK